MSAYIGIKNSDGSYKLCMSSRSSDISSLGCLLKENIVSASQVEAMLNTCRACRSIVKKEDYKETSIRGKVSVPSSIPNIPDVLFVDIQNPGESAQCYQDLTNPMLQHQNIFLFDKESNKWLYCEKYSSVNTKFYEIPDKKDLEVIYYANEQGNIVEVKPWLDSANAKANHKGIALSYVVIKHDFSDVIDDGGYCTDISEVEARVGNFIKCLGDRDAARAYAREVKPVEIPVKEVNTLKSKFKNWFKR